MMFSLRHAHVRWLILALTPTVVLACAGGDEGDAASDPDATSASDSTASDDHSNPDPDKAPVLVSAEAHQSGPAGRALSVTIDGTDINRDTIRARILVFDQSNAPVLAFYGSLSSEPDSHETFVTFPSGVRGRPEFTSTIVLETVMQDYPSIANIEVSLEDAAGNRSNALPTAVTVQSVKNAGEECDPEYVGSRCPAGMACKGEPAICDEGDAPEVTDLGYYPEAEPPAIVVIGTEPEEDIDSLLIEFFDADGNPVQVALNSEETADVLEYDREVIEARGHVGHGMFAVRLEPAGDFTNLVHEIAVTPKDASGHTGTRTTVLARKAKTAGNGSACDPWGFVSCWDNSSCVPGVAGEVNKCESHLSMKKDLCKSAPELELVAGVAEVGGIAAGASAYEPPTMCISNSGNRRPESVFKLVLDEPVARLTVTTDLPGTNFDTIVYLAPDCGEQIEEALACGDDTKQPDGGLHGAGSFELENVKAGEYVIVVDSWVPEGGNFALRVQAE